MKGQLADQTNKTIIYHLKKSKELSMPNKVEVSKEEGKLKDRMGGRVRDVVLRSYGREGKGKGNCELELAY